MAQQDGELVTTDAGRDIAGADDLAERAADLDENRVTRGMAEGVVDRFEPVEVYEHQRADRRVGKCASNGVLKMRPVGEPPAHSGKAAPADRDQPRKYKGKPKR